MKKGQRKAAIALLTVAGGSGEPPEETRRRQDRSSCGSKGLLTSSITMVEAKLVTDTRSVSAKQVKCVKMSSMQQGRGMAGRGVGVGGEWSCVAYTQGCRMAVSTSHVGQDVCMIHEGTLCIVIAMNMLYCSTACSSAKTTLLYMHTLEACLFLAKGTTTAAHAEACNDLW